MKSLTKPLRLDDTFSKPLQRGAWGSSLGGRAGSEAAAFRYMTSEPVQQKLDMLAEMSSASTLDVERRHVVAKRAEARRLSSCAKVTLRAWEPRRE